MRQRKRDERLSTSALLDEILDETEARADAPCRLDASHGRSVTVGLGGDTIQVRDRDGVVELEVCLTADGPRLRIEGAALELVAARSVAVRCETFTVEAELEAAITVRRGDVRIDAGDDVVVTGERVLLN